MPTLLHLDSSMAGEASRTRAITRAFAQAWRARGTDYTVVYRDLHADPLPHLADPALHVAPRLRTTTPAEADQRRQTAVLDELTAADVVLIGCPLYNFSLPSTLKVWLDYVHVLGLTTTFDGPTQPVAGKPVVVAMSRGGWYDEDSPTHGWDHGTPVLQIVLGNALGMSLTVLQADLAAAETVPALADQLPRSRAEFAAAVQRAAELGTELG
jgi:FMN-dependent NADH-azoreductase